MKTPVDWAAMTAPLEPLLEDLDATVLAIEHEEARTTQALAARIEAMEAFDDWYNRGARTLECTYVLLGLPTLAAAAAAWPARALARWRGRGNG